MTKILELLNGVKDNKYTTIIGAIAIAYGVYEILSEEGDKQWGIGLIIIGAGFLFSKDGSNKDQLEEKDESPNQYSDNYNYQPRNFERPQISRRHYDPEEYKQNESWDDGGGSPYDYPENDIRG